MVIRGSFYFQMKATTGASRRCIIFRFLSMWIQLDEGGGEVCTKTENGDDGVATRAALPEFPGPYSVVHGGDVLYVLKNKTERACMKSAPSVLLS